MVYINCLRNAQCPQYTLWLCCGVLLVSLVRGVLCEEGATHKKIENVYFKAK